MSITLIGHLPDLKGEVCRREKSTFSYPPSADMKGVLDYLREMREEAAGDAAGATDRCRRVPLPEVFSFPRKLGRSWGCLREGAFRGEDAVVVEASAKGAYVRYILPYDARSRRYVYVYRERARPEGASPRISWRLCTSWRRGTRWSSSLSRSLLTEPSQG